VSRIAYAEGTVELVATLTGGVAMTARAVMGSAFGVFH
jgi:hypothetical protein